MIENKYLKVYNDYDEFAEDILNLDKNKPHVGYITNQFEVVYLLPLEIMWKRFGVKINSYGSVSLNYKQNDIQYKVLPNIIDPERIKNINNFLKYYPYIEYIPNMNTINLRKLDYAFANSKLKKFPKLNLDKIDSMYLFIDRCNNIEDLTIENITGNIVNVTAVIGILMNIKTINTKHIKNIKLDVNKTIVNNITTIDVLNFEFWFYGDARDIKSNAIIKGDAITFKYYIFGKEIYANTVKIEYINYNQRLNIKPYVECNILDIRLNNYYSNTNFKWDIDINSKIKKIIINDYVYIPFNFRNVNVIINAEKFCNRIISCVCDSTITAKDFNDQFDDNGNIISGYMDKNDPTKYYTFGVNIFNVYNVNDTSVRQDVNLDFTNNPNKILNIHIGIINKGYADSGITIRNPIENTIIYENTFLYNGNLIFEANERRIINDKDYLITYIHRGSSCYETFIKGKIKTNYIYYTTKEDYNIINNYNETEIFFYNNELHICIGNDVKNIDLSKFNLKNLINRDLTKIIKWRIDGFTSFIKLNIDDFIINNKLYTRFLPIVYKYLYNESVNEIIIDYLDNYDTAFNDYLDKDIIFCSNMNDKDADTGLSLFGIGDTSDSTHDTIKLKTIDNGLFILNFNFIKFRNIIGDCKFIVRNSGVFKFDYVENIDFTYCGIHRSCNTISINKLTKLNSSSIKKLLIALIDNSDNNIKSLTINNTQSTYLTEEEITNFTNKNYELIIQD